MPKSRGQCSEVKGHELGWFYMRETKTANEDNQVSHAYTLSNTLTFTMLLPPVTHRSCSRLNNELRETNKVTAEER